MSTLRGGIGGSARSPRRYSRFGIPFFFASARPNATILRRVVDRDHFLRAAREQLRKPAFARAQVGHHDMRNELRQQRPDLRPGPAGTKTFTEASGHAVEIIARGGAALFQDRA